MLTHGELFAGISGFGLGFQRAGITLCWAVEIDQSCQSVLRHHHPEIDIFSDVCEVGAHNLTPVDIISFGSPCQDLSVAGRRKGLDGERSGLFFEAIRVCAELRPTFAVWENVPGAFSSNSGRDFAAVLAAFRECGARDIAWRVLDAQYLGVAQRRRRVFVVADFGGERAAQVLFEPESLPGNPAPSREAGERVTALTSCGVGTCGADDNQAQGGHLVASALTARYAKSTDSEDGTGRGTPLVTCPTLKSAGGSWGSEEPCAIEGLRTSDISPQLTCGGGKPGDGYPCVAFTERTRAAGRTLECQGELSYALTNPGGGGRAHCRSIAHGMSVRRLTPIECERLQGFPDGWTEGQSDTARYRQLGNAVCVPVAEWIGRRIMQAN